MRPGCLLVRVIFGQGQVWWAQVSWGDTGGLDPSCGSPAACNTYNRWSYLHLLIYSTLPVA